ncbi:MAG: methylated-DNA--[protein]-cysteine S-methyltransferase [Planctomycetes bacterium]|nr:methylated-DNA--[protein]-cysteine S-methyltransferase [Planctomycetota bacterium]
MQYAIVKTAWGAFGFVTRGKELVATFLPESRQSLKRAIKTAYPEATETPHLMPRFRKQVDDYFAGKRTAFSVDLDLSEVPEFRRRVLEACRRIPYGRVATYAELARAVGCPGAARAVGGAMAHNPVPLVIPCHRVLRSDGSLGGFSGSNGVKTKKRMLALEDALPETKPAPRKKPVRRAKCA